MNGAVDAPRRSSDGPAARRIAKAVGRWLDAHAAVGSLITVACSGGADSLALAAATATEATRQGHPIAAATVDHGLQAGSSDQAAHTAELLRELGYTQVKLLTVTVGGRGGPEAAARRARYEALHPLAGTGSILLGHTLDDQAETVLLGLSRGSGPRSIAGMADYQRPYGRPLLAVRRADTVAACAEAGLSPWQDPHNDDPAFTRVRLRHEVLPLLEEVLGGGVAAALARTASQLREDGELLDALATDLLARSLSVGSGLHVRQLRPRPVALRRRVLRLWLTAGGVGGLTADHLHALDRLVTSVNPVGAVRLPGHLDAGIADGLLELGPAR